MATNINTLDIDFFLKLENEGLLPKACRLYDTEGRLVEQYTTKQVWQNGKALSSVGKAALYRQYFYDANDNQSSSVPIFKLWDQICEDISSGIAPAPVLPPTSGGGGSVQKIIPIYGEVTVISLATTKIVEYTAPTGGAYLSCVDASGGNIGQLIIDVDSGTVAKKRFYWGDFDKSVDFQNGNRGIELEDGDKVEVYAENCYTCDADYNATIKVVEK